MYKLKIFFLVLLSLIGYQSVHSQSFVDVSTDVGIDHVFKQFSNMGGGVVFFDYNNDGWEDLYITGGINKDNLYKNLGDGNFMQVTDSWIDITENFYTMGVISGDVNNDGFRDIYVSTWREVVNSNMNGNLKRNLLFINDGNGGFNEKSVDFKLTNPSFSMGAAMLDYNNDGLLDIYEISYIENSIATYDADHIINGFAHECYENKFYYNNGDNTFTEMSTTLGLNNSGCALAVMPTDFDQDYDQDIYIANDFGEFVVANTILQNEYPTNQFNDVSVTTNMGVGIYGMGIAYADIDKDGDFDYYVTNLGRNVLLENDGDQSFSDISTQANVENTYAENSNNELFTTSWGTAFFDINNNTWPDLFVANGRIPAASFIATGEDDPNKLYINNGDKTFTDVSVGSGVADYNRGRGMAYSDYDKDGDLDMIVIVQDGSPNPNAKTVLYQNQLNPNDTNLDNDNWLQIELEGTEINKDAIGAKVEITVNGEKSIQEVHGQGSHCSQHSLILHFGLNDNTVIDELKVIWSSTDIQTTSNININKRYHFVQGQSLNIQENSNQSNIYAYPNPTNGNLYFRGINKEYELEIYTVQGILLNKFTIDNYKNYISIANYASGIYLSNLIDENGVSVNKEFIVKI